MKRIAKELDFTEERREVALIKSASYQQRLKQYNQKVNLRKFKEGDMVLGKVQGNTKNPANGKLRPNWEGPYKVTQVGGNEAYSLETMKGKPVPRNRIVQILG